MGGLFRWNVSYVLHDTMLIPSSCGMLVYRLVTSIDTSIVPFATFVFASSKWRIASSKICHYTMALNWHRNMQMVMTSDETQIQIFAYRPMSQVSWKSRIEDRGSRIEDRGSRIEDRGSRIEDRGSRTEDQGSRIKDQGSRIKDRGSKIED